MSAGVLLRRSVPGASAPGRHRALRPSPCQAAGALFWVVVSLAYWRVPPCCDAGQHAAVIERLRSGLLEPRHPMADLPGAGSPYYSPYAVTEGVLARLTGLTGWQLLRVAGPLNLLVLLGGLGRFVRVLTERRWAPVLALGCVTLLWGTERAWWSGYLGLMPLTGNLGYPSTFATGLTLWAWALTGRRARDAGPVRFVGPRGLRGPGGYAGLGVLYGVVLLVHPITAVAAGLGASACVAGWQRRWRPRVAARWLLTAAVALAVAAAWPYFDLFALAGDGRLDAIHEVLYRDVVGHFWLAALGLPALGARARRSRGRDPLVLMFALDCLVVAYGRVSGHFTYGRVLGPALLGPQLAAAVEVAAARPWAPWRRALGWVTAAGACLGLVTVQAGAVVPRSLDPVGLEQPPRWPSYGWAARHMRRGDVVLTDGYRALHSIAGYGVNLVAPLWPDRALDERVRQRRARDVRAYLDGRTSRAGRLAVVRRYHVRWLLLTRGQPVPGEAVTVARSRRTGEVLARVGG
ncbi:hypothetical protein [Streptomyces sp. NPDC004065]|uniref:hypothetical protein n=1 Tax=Streptomyces sp. NPDC004065 TaxID=3364689 RepID=UPI00384BBA34